MRRLLLLFYFLGWLVPQSGSAQSTCTEIPDFSNLTGPCVRCYTGTWEDPFQKMGRVDNRHSLITQSELDPLTGAKLPTIPPGATSSVRLGNSKTGGEGEAVVFRCKVVPDKSLLMVRFAVVFEDPGHEIEVQPRFTVRVTNAQGELVEACATYDVFASAEIDGFFDYYGTGSPIRWRPWTSIGINLEQYIGQEIHVEFISRDCGYSGHFGYSYFSAECTANQLSLLACSTDSIELTAPFGFERYQWDNGDTLAKQKRKLTGEPQRIYCAITSLTGCQFTLNAYVHDTTVSFLDTIIYDTVCQDMPYTKHNYNLPKQKISGTFSHVNNYFDPVLCFGNRRSLLRLTVLQIYYPLTAAICAGNGYHENGFSIDNPPPGLWRDTLRCSAVSGCDSILCLELVVSPSFNLPLSIMGPKKPCSNTPVSFYLPNAVGPGTYRWRTQSGAHLLGDTTKPTLRVLFHDKQERDTIRLLMANGCGSGELFLEVFPQPSYYRSFVDSSCVRQAYQQRGFSLPGEELEGLYAYANRLKTQCDCDSIETLYLHVFPTPEVEIVADKEMICLGDSVSLKMQLEVEDSIDIIVRLGDILCSDGSILSPDQYIESGKTGEAVVFYVDRTRRHGWAIGPKIEQGGWMSVEDDIPDLPNFTDKTNLIALKQHPIFDTAGYSNTRMMREYGDATVCPIAWKIDFENGWYFPAAGQLKNYYSVVEIINPSIRLLGGDEHHTLENEPPEGWKIGWALHSSTENSFKNCYYISSGGALNTNPKSGQKYYRKAKNF